MRPEPDGHRSPSSWFGARAQFAPYTISIPLLLISPVLPAVAADPSESSLPAAAAQKVEFLRDIKPILQNHCFKCHSDEKPKAHFRLTTREAALKGGEHGVDIIPGQSARSPLIRYVARLDEDLAMPPEGRGTPLTALEVGLLRAWIDQGVVWDPIFQQPPLQLLAIPIAGGTAIRGDAKLFRQLYWQRDGWNGGLDQFEMRDKPSVDWVVTASGHVLLDDYKIDLSAEKTDLGLARFGWSQFREYYDDMGGYYPGFTPAEFSLGRDLHTDKGRAWTEFGLTLPRWPRVLVGYEYQYRDGSESTLHWGPVSNGTQTRNIYPAFRTVSERTHVLKLDAEYELAGISLSDNLRGEWYRLEDHAANVSSYTLGASGAALTTAAERTSYFQGANAVHLEKQLTDWCLASGGYLYSRLNGDGGLTVDTLNPVLLDPALGAPGWDSQSVQLERESHVCSISSLLGPWHGFDLSLGTQNEWTRQNGFTTAAVNIALPFAPFIFPLNPPEILHSELDRSIFSQDLGLRFSKIPSTTLFADARFQQDDLGEYQEEVSGLTPFLRNTEMKSDLKDFRVGFNTSPWRRFSWSADFRRYDKATEYETPFREPAILPGYPGFIRWRDLLSDQAQTKLSISLTAWLKTSLTYQWLENQYRTETDPVDDPLAALPGGISPGGRLLAGRYDSHITSVNATLTPWPRLFFSATFAFQHARTLSEANDTPGVAPYTGDIYSLLLSGTYSLNHKTDLIAAYSFSTADFGQDNFAGGLPLGTRYSQHAVQAGIRRQLAKNKNLGVQYRYYQYADSSAGPASAFDAHALFATLAWRLP